MRLLLLVLTFACCCPASLVDWWHKYTPGPLMETLEDRPALLRVNDDVLMEICDAVKQVSRHKGNVTIEADVQTFKSLAQTNGHMRQLMTPELFKSVRVGIDWDWDKALGAVESLEKCAAIQDHTKQFFRYIDLFIGSVSDGLNSKGPRPPKDLPVKLARVLDSMKKLQKATLIIPAHHTEPFREAFEAEKVTLPSVVTLLLGPHMDWIIPMCPNVTTISTHDWRWIHENVDGDYNQRHSYDLIKSAGSAKKLQHFELMGPLTPLNADMAEIMLEVIPEVPSLAMTGDLHAYSISDLLPTLSKFRNLTTLTTAGSHALGVGFEPPMCGNIYMQPGGDEVWRQVQEEGRQADVKVANMVFSACRKLQTLWIGDHARATVRRGGEGEVLEVVVEDGERDSPTYWPN